jgi:hypothetical protein
MFKITTSAKDRCFFYFIPKNPKFGLVTTRAKKAQKTPKYAYASVFPGGNAARRKARKKPQYGVNALGRRDKEGFSLEPVPNHPGPPEPPRQGNRADYPRKIPPPASFFSLFLRRIEANRRVKPIIY